MRRLPQPCPPWSRPRRGHAHSVFPGPFGWPLVRRRRHQSSMTQWRSRQRRRRQYVPAPPSSMGALTIVPFPSSPDMDANSIYLIVEFFGHTRPATRPCPSSAFYFHGHALLGCAVHDTACPRRGRVIGRALPSRPRRSRMSPCPRPAPSSTVPSTTFRPRRSFRPRGRILPRPRCRHAVSFGRADNDSAALSFRGMKRKLDKFCEQRIKN